MIETITFSSKTRTGVRENRRALSRLARRPPARRGVLAAVNKHAALDVPDQVIHIILPVDESQTFTAKGGSPLDIQWFESGA